jgi:transposase
VKRRWWRRWQRKPSPDQLVFLDETWAKTNMTRIRGRSIKGTRLVEHVPQGHWKTTTFLAGIRTHGWVAPLVIDGAINGKLFLAWVQQHLTKELKRGDIVIMDNLSSHKVKGVVEAIESVGASVQFLPPYSPDLNPIEMAFSKLKRLIRSAKNRDVESLWGTCGKVLQRFTETEFRNLIKHAGYRYN